jgi:peptidoglycan/LPS O-acetylase OafA/YrhL
MTRINYWRVVGGGLLAGIVINLCEFVVNGLWLKNQWADAMKALNRPTDMSVGQTTAFNVWGFLMGISAVWLYSEMRDRYGPGWRNALCAAAAVWVIGYLSGTISGVAMGIFPAGLMMTGAAAGLIEMVVGTELGAWYYRPAE